MPELNSGRLALPDGAGGLGGSEGVVEALEELSDVLRDGAVVRIQAAGGGPAERIEGVGVEGKADAQAVHGWKEITGRALCFHGHGV